jgi:outer membrane protein insertion porin family
MFNKLTAIQAGVLAVLSPCVFAANSFIVKDIRVEGIQRTEAGTVFNYLPIHVGDTVTDETVSRAVKALFATGFYRDVRIDVDKDVLVVIVDERPAIAQVQFSGNKEFTSDVLLKGLKDVGIAESRTFDRSMLEKAEQEIKRLYLTRSFYAVSIKTTTSPMERNRVAINFEITEGEVARIKDIKIIGAKAFKEGRLLDLMTLERSGWIPWFSEDKYSKQKLQADIEEVKSWYLDRGYLNFNVDSTQVSITPDKKDVYITIAISEGEQYQISSIKLAGELLVPEDELRKLVTVKGGEFFSRSKVNETTRLISDRLGNDGYAFANVNAAPEIDQEKHEVALTFFVDPGRRAYVNRINVTGNSRTRDEVVRREMRQTESAWFDRERVDRSKLNIDRTGFFEEVNIDTVAVPGTSDQVDLAVNVKEKPTGALTLGVGYSATDKVVLSGSISQNNLFGTGNALTLNMNTGKVNRNIGASYTNPYWTKDGVSRGFDVYNKRVDPTSLSTVATYKSDSVGGGVRFGVPIGEDDTINLGLSLDRTKIETYDDSPVQYTRFVDQFGNINTSVLTTLGWARDKRDSAVYPTTGTYQRVSSEIAVPPGEMRYGRLNYQWQRYFALNRTFTLMLNTDFGIAQGYGGRPVPFYKNYYAGGIGTIRGYKDSTVGPRVVDSSGNETSESLGGTRRWLGSAEVLFPFPGMKDKSRTVRLSGFFDIGVVWGPDTKFKASDLRMSVGTAVSWSSPIGPLKFSVGIPLKKKEGDETQRFQFQIGTVF